MAHPNDKAPASAPAATPGRMVQLENRTRSVWLFPKTKSIKRPGDQPPQLVTVHRESLVLGDAKDKSLRPGVERGPRCPSPVALVPEADLSPEKFGVANRALLDTLVAKGDIEWRVV